MASPRATDGDDTADFRFVGGRICLDFVATLGRRHTEPVERLPDPAALVRWLGAAGLRSPDSAAAGFGETGLAQARMLREAAHRLVRAGMRDLPYAAADVVVVNRAAAHPDLVPQLAAGEAGPGVRWGQGRDAGAALATVARDTVLLLGGPLIRRVKECGNPTCSLLFLDDSQASRRRWCSMDRCGNLAKVAGYRARARREQADKA